MMSHPTSIIIHGQSQAQRPPERGEISLSISATGSNPVTVSESVQKALAQVRQEIESLAAQDNPNLTATSSTPEDERASSTAATICGPTKKVTTFNIAAPSSRSWQRQQPNPSLPPMKDPAGNPIKEHESSVHLTVRFGDFAALGGFAIDMAKLDHVQVQRVHWSLTPDTERGLRAEAIRNAYNDALEKARGFAAAMGRDADRVRPVEIKSENDGMQGSFYGRGVRTMQTARVATGASDFSPSPKDVVYEVECEVKFESH